MIVGDSVCAMFSIDWERPRRGTLADPRKWLSDRFKRLGVLPEGTPPAAGNFSACDWAHGVQSEEDKHTTYWYGYAEPAELVLGVKVNGVLPHRLRRQLVERVLPTLQTTPADAPTTWAMYDLSFQAPPGFHLARRHLFSGDVALEFHRGRSQTLMLRQVYPGELALQRRPYERWLDAYPFNVHRRLRASSIASESWRHASRDDLSGLCRRGRKCLPFPLGVVWPRHTHALAVHDRTLNRLLIAEHLSATEPDGSLCRSAILGMNLAPSEDR